MDPQEPTINPTVLVPRSPVSLLSPQSPQSPQGIKDSHWISILAMAIFVVLTLGVVAFLYYQNQALKSMLASLQTPVPVVSPTPTATADPTASWKTYTNTKYNFSFKYPSDWGTLDKFGGPLMIAPVSDIENVSKTFKNNILEGGYDGGKQLVSLLSITEGLGGSSSDQYWEVVKTSIQIDSKTAEKYVSTNIKDTPNGKFFKGDIETEILIPLKDNFIMSYALIDQRYATIFDQILSTFKFITATSSGSPTPVSKACTQEAKLCPDGSSVGRTGPNCEFAPCP